MGVKWTASDLQNLGQNKGANTRIPAAEAKALFTKEKRSSKPVKWQGEGIRLDIKPLSVNGAWQGKRYKTEAYRIYEKRVLQMLPKLTLPEPPFKLSLVFGFSNIASDIDNPCKCLIDILQKAYSFNDRHITELHIKKEIVPKGAEFIKFEILTAA